MFQLTPEQLEYRNKRRQRNRECAQRLRDRRNNLTYELQTKIKRLEAENQDLRQKMKNKNNELENFHINELTTRIQELEAKNHYLEVERKMANTFHKIKLSTISTKMYGLKWSG